jgi:hypothetical protein
MKNIPEEDLSGEKKRSENQEYDLWKYGSSCNPNLR